MQQPWVRVALALPIGDLFDYRLPEGMETLIGQRVRVPFAAKELIALVIEKPAQPAYEESAIKEVLEVYDDLPPMPADWIAFGEFAGNYYQRPLGEVLLPSLPKPLRNPTAYTSVQARGGPVRRLLTRRSNAAKKAAKAAAKAAKLSKEKGESIAEQPKPLVIRPTLSDAQQAALEHIAQVDGYRTVLLHGVTGSGKTEVYLHAAERNCAALKNRYPKHDKQLLRHSPLLTELFYQYCRNQQSAPLPLLFWHSAQQQLYFFLRF